MLLLHRSRVSLSYTSGTITAYLHFIFCCMSIPPSPALNTFINLIFTLACISIIYFSLSLSPTLSLSTSDPMDSASGTQITAPKLLRTHARNPSCHVHSAVFFSFSYFCFCFRVLFYFPLLLYFIYKIPFLLLTYYTFIHTYIHMYALTHILVVYIRWLLL